MSSAMTYTEVVSRVWKRWCSCNFYPSYPNVLIFHGMARHSWLSGDKATLAEVREMLQRVLVSGHADPARARVAVREHAAIVDALEAKDPDLAEARLREHLSDSRRFLKLRRQEEKGESSC